MKKCDHCDTFGPNGRCVECGSLEDLVVDQIQARFLEFHQANPHVYNHLVKLVREAVSAGVSPGIKSVWEVLRWDLTVRTTQDAGFKLNNNFHSRYARLIDDQELDLRDVFEFRTLTARGV